MTPDEALDVLAEAVTCAAVRELVENGLWDSYVEAELSDSASSALRERLSARAAAGPDPATLFEALGAQARTLGP